MPLYDVDYPEQIKEAKRRAAIAPTALDSLAPDLRSAFERDSVFELLHFVPLYFVPSEPDEMLASIEAAAAGRDADSFGASVIASVIQGRERRRTLSRFVRALREEWRLFFHDYWLRGAPGRSTAIAAAQERWDHAIEPALLPFLSDQALAGGTVFVSDALGGEGRVFSRAPADPVDNLAAVRVGPGRGSPALALLRELCYPLVSRLVAEQGLGGIDRVQSEQIASRGAVRCGALLLDRYAPDQAEQYRASYMAQVPFRAPTFDQTFEIPDSLILALRRALRLP